MKKVRVLRLALLAFVVVNLTACAAGPRQSQGLTWVVEQQAERQRLQAQGFPQYAHD
mgnify:CR=1 FL=1